MREIFTRGEFDLYKSISLNESLGEIRKSYSYYEKKKTSVFLSHKHDDLEDLKGVIGFLERNYSVKAYIDSADPTMPAVTSGETAERIKQRITDCERFILLATNGAIESKWCNWELGFGDAQKMANKKIAIFPMKDKGQFDFQYKGNEYMDIYPSIIQCSGAETYRSTGRPIPAGLYVRYKMKDKPDEIVPLADWFK